MANVFNPGGAAQPFNGAFRAEDLTATFGGQSGVGALVQQAQFTVNRTVNMLYEVGSNNVYYVGNRRQGTAQLNRVVSSSDIFKQLLEKFGNMCTPDTLTLTAGGGCGGGGGIVGAIVNAVVGGGNGAAGTVHYDLKNATLTSIGGSVSAQEIIINEQLGFICSDIDVA
jgi:hypothetical protein